MNPVKSKRRSRYARWILALLVVDSMFAVFLVLDAGNGGRSARPGGDQLALDPPGRLSPASLGRDTQRLGAQEASRVTAWSPRSVTMPAPKVGETAPVRNLRIGELDAINPGTPPNPFVEPKLELSREEMGMSSERSR